MRILARLRTLFWSLTWMEWHVGIGVIVWSHILQPDTAPFLPITTGAGALAFYQADHLLDAWRSRGPGLPTKRDAFYLRWRWWIGLLMLAYLALIVFSLPHLPIGSWWHTVLPAAAGTMLYSIFVHVFRRRQLVLRTLLIGMVFGISVAGLPVNAMHIPAFAGACMAAIINVLSLHLRNGTRWVLFVGGLITGFGLAWTGGPVHHALGALCLSQGLPALIWTRADIRAAVADWLIFIIGLLFLSCKYF